MIVNIIASTFAKISNHGLIILLSLLFMLAYDQQKKTIDKVNFDASVEIRRLVIGGAGEFDYSSEDFYNIDRIVQDELSHEDHILINFVKQTGEGNSIDCDIVMCVTISIDDEFNLKIAYNDGSSEAHWNNNNAIKYLKLLKYIVYR